MVDEKVEKKVEGEKKEEATPNTDAGISAKEEESNIKKIKETVEAQKLENDRKFEILDREEKLMARKEALAALGGGSSAGDKPQGETEDEKWSKGAKERYGGTGMNPTDEEW